MERENLSVKYQPGNLTNGDGVRPWHELTITRERVDGRGFKLWLGEYNKRHEIEQLVRFRTVGQFEAIWSPSYFFIPEIPSHIGHCGLYWIGISRFPLNKFWERATAKWSGWAHIVHWKDQGSLRKMPSPNLIFQLAHEVLIEIGYPNSLRDFSQTLISELSLDIKKSLIYESFPYLKNHQS